MKKMIRLNYKNKVIKEYETDTPILEVVKDFQKYYNYDIVAVKADNEIMELSDVVTKDCMIDFFDRSTKVGNNIYARSLQFMIVLAVKRVMGYDTEIMIEHSMDKGVYCEILDSDFDKPVLNKIEEEMHRIVKEDLIFTKLSVARIDAMNYYKRKKQTDKVSALKYISNTYVNLYRLDDIYDYFYGEMAYSTKAINDFDLTYIKDNGFVLSYPDLYNPECTLEYKHHNMVFNTFLDYTKWGKMIGIENAADLNQIISRGEYETLIHLAEAYYNNQLSHAAAKIYDNKENIKMVLIAGPSSSGKTTTAKKLEIYLRSRGLNTYQISVDDYFVNKIDTPLDENGNLDLESLRAVDVQLFNQHLTKLLDGEKVLLPQYNFITGEREYHKKWVQLKKDDVIIIEGLHGLNEELTLSVERRNKFKIYISPLTQLNIDNHNRIHTSDTRRLRRIVRDSKHRGYSAAETLKQWDKISMGEEKYIFPYQDDADMVINSALVYELGVLKTYVEPLLFSVEEDDEMYPEALRLINLLRNLLSIPSDTIAPDSVLREFIGGSCFKD
ncbi:MAG: nucleoside kinase [Bacilli bacterium]|nr:nucleoside kinase [Bacilli bacterium]